MTDVRDEVGADTSSSKSTEGERERSSGSMFVGGRRVVDRARSPTSASSDYGGECRGSEGAGPLEAQFVVRESGRIGFVAQFWSKGRPHESSSIGHFSAARLVARAPLPSSLSVGALAFTLAPRNRAMVRRIVVVEGRMPDLRMSERPRAYVERIGSARELITDLGCAIGRRGDLRLSSAIELARGTYAIAAHRDHVHLLYELEPRRLELSEATDDLTTLLAELRISPRGSLLTAIALGPRSMKPIVAFEPTLLDHEGVELVFGSRPLARSLRHA